MNKTKIVTTKRNVKYFTFDIFDNYNSHILAAFSTRKGGVSKGIFESMNLSLNTEDKLNNVLSNYRIMAEALKIDYQNFVLSDQKHHDHIKYVTSADKGKGIAKKLDYSDIDGLITDIPNICLVTQHADCTPVFFFDPVKKVIALAHAGWLGTVLEIVAKMVDKMVSDFDSNPENILIAIGPTICGNCYEVDNDVAHKLKNISIDTKDFIGYNQKTNKFFPDLAKINAALALSKGILKENLAVSDICTKENLDIFFSHRGHHGKRGGMAAFLMLKV